MGIIKVNYNNIYVNKPGNISPSVFAYRYHLKNEDSKKIYILVNSRLKEETYYTNFNFEIYVNNDLLKTLDARTSNKIILDNQNFYNEEVVVITVKGYYRDEYNKYYFDDIVVPCHIIPLASENILSSEDVIVNDLIEGYIINNNKFYLTKLNDTIYTDEITKLDNSYYYDLLTNLVYKYIKQKRIFEKI